VNARYPGVVNKQGYLIYKMIPNTVYKVFVHIHTDITVTMRNIIFRKNSRKWHFVGRDRVRGEYQSREYQYQITVFRAAQHDENEYT
jgi:hypothetical protein